MFLYIVTILFLYIVTILFLYMVTILFLYIVTILFLYIVTILYLYMVTMLFLCIVTILFLYYTVPIRCNYYRYILPIDYSDLYTQTCDVNEDEKEINIPNCEGNSYLNSILYSLLFYHSFQLSHFSLFYSFCLSLFSFCLKIIAEIKKTSKAKTDTLNRTLTHLTHFSQKK